MSNSSRETIAECENDILEKVMAQMGISDPVEANRRIRIGQWVMEKREPKIPKFRTFTLRERFHNLPAMKFFVHLRERGIEVEPEASKIFCKTYSLFEGGEIRLIRLSVSQLGFKKGATFDEIENATFHLGLKFCPSWVGHHLWLSLPNVLSVGMRLVVGMYPVETAVGESHLYYLARYKRSEGGRILGAINVSSEKKFAPHTNFVFVRSK